MPGELERVLLPRHTRDFLVELCSLIEADYADRWSSPSSGPIRRIVSGTLQASLVPANNRTLIVRGSDEAGDWLRNFLSIPSAELKGASGTKFHAGFLIDAKVLYNEVIRLRDERLTPSMITGHSRGAAIAAIVGASLKIPVICFACPKPVYGKLKGELSDDGIVVYNRSDDLVGKVPLSWKWRHLGRVIKLVPTSRHYGEDHRIVHYKTMLRTEEYSING